MMVNGMNRKKNVENTIVVGIDLSKYYVQISCLDSRMEEVQTIATQMGTEQYEIPLCMFRKTDSDNWCYGEQARSMMHSGDGIYVEDLWEGALCHKEVFLEDGSYTYEKLMNIYLKKAMQLIYQNGYSGKMDSIVFTVEHLTQEKIELLREITEDFSVDRHKIFFVDYKESFCAYVTSQKKELWNHEVYLFHYYDRCLKGYGLRVNQKTTPFRIKIEELDFGELEYGKEELEDSEDAGMQMDERFSATIQTLFEKKVVSSVFLIGEGFQPGWMKESLRILCRGRRVFQGNNLFTKGACYAGRWYLKISQPAGVYQTENLLPCDVRIPVEKNGKEDYVVAAQCGEPWYAAGMDVECIVDMQESVRIEMIPNPYQENTSAKIEVFHLIDFPKRPRKASKIRLKLFFTDVHTAKILVEDKGFGEFYPSSGLRWEKQFSIEKEE